MRKRVDELTHLAFLDIGIERVLRITNRSSAREGFGALNGADKYKHQEPQDQHRMARPQRRRVHFQLADWVDVR